MEKFLLCDQMYVLFLIFSAIYSCGRGREQMNNLRMYAEELERLLQSASFTDEYDYNRTKHLTFVMVEQLWDCTYY